MIVIKTLVRAFCILGLSAIGGCKQKGDSSVKGQQADSLEITSVHTLDSIPSGSGILMLPGDSMLIVGDDATAVFLANVSTNKYREIPILNYGHKIYRENKDNKHDFESATWAGWKGRRYLLAFGSGSDKAGRDSLLFMDINVPAERKIISLRSFYRSLRMQTKTDSLAWNIEGSAVVGDTLVLMNRGNNVIITMNVNDFLDYLFNGADVPLVQHFKVELPALENKEARLSGVSALAGSDILFCASVEDTPDWTKDGPVLGSYIGIYSLKDRKPGSFHLLKDKDGKLLKEKIESVDVINAGAESLRIVAIGDNDDGSSKVFKIVMQR